MNIKRFIYGLFATSILCAGSQTTKSQVVINEALASNSSYTSPIYDIEPDWIELYNNGTSAVDLGGMSLSISATNPRQFTFPAGVTIPARGYYLIACSTKFPKSEHNTGFNLSAFGETINLYSASSTSAPVDTLDFGLQLTDYSVGRIPDGTGKFQLCVPTQEAPNKAQTMGTITSVKINEVCAGPDDWFEVYNAGANPVALGGYYFTTKPSKDPLMFEIPALTFIGTGDAAFLVYYADKDTDAGKDHVNFKIAKEADNIALMTSGRVAVNIFDYPDMLDYEAYGRIPDGGTAIRKQPGAGSPGASNYLELETVVISEILTHTDYPDTPPDFIELQNISASPLDISGWGLSDSSKNLMKYIFPTGTVIQPGAFFVVTEFEFNDESNPNCQTPFRLNSYEGETAFLTQIVNSSPTGYRSQVLFGAAPNNLSFIRHVNADGEVHYPFGEYPTMEKTNAPVKIGPIVINEIHYKPAGEPEPMEDEFIELFNITDQEVPLYYPGYPDDPAMIENGIRYIFPEGTTMPPGGYALVVPFNPKGGTAASFREKFNVPEEVSLYGPYSGKLSNDGETIELLFPDTPQKEDDFVPYYLVDKVNYTATAPWPTNAKGTGRSIQRLNAFTYGDESGNWGAYAGTDTTQYVTPGRRSSVGMTDQDFDGMPDDWELKYQFDPFNPADAQEDANGDGITNLQHYLDGTNPRAPIQKDPVNLEIIANAESVTLSFIALAAASYEVQVSDNAQTGWSFWKEVESGEERLIELNDLLGTTARYYRVITQ
jgi:hypothetical protein